MRLLGLDVDPSALALAGRRLKAFIEEGRARLVRSNFERLDEVAEAEGFAPVDGVLLDLGVSSMQPGQAGAWFFVQGSRAARYPARPERADHSGGPGERTA